MAEKNRCSGSTVSRPWTWTVASTRGLWPSTRADRSMSNGVRGATRPVVADSRSTRMDVPFM